MINMKLLAYIYTLIVTRIALVEGFSFTPSIKTKYGVIYGIVNYSRSGRPYYAFKGIPYAKPPVGNLRFKAPEPPKKWLGTRPATMDGPICIQKNYLFENPITIGQEDCLYLNVYTQIPINYIYHETLLPVMVYIHWGGFFAGRGTSDYMGPNYFMDENVILVTFNYRLGPFGFLTTLDDAAPGNYGLKDQVLVLRWVQENIHYFGGNKSRVTIFGQSAGAASVHYHLLSPLSKGLFQHAISQSGSALALWAQPTNTLQPTVLAAQSKFVNCDTHLGNSTGLIECLRRVSANLLMETQDLFKTFFVDPLTVYTIVTENQTKKNPAPFITKSPIEYIQANEFAKVPWIIGLVEDEGILKASSILRRSEVRNQLNSNFESILNELMYFSLSTANPHSLYLNVVGMYLQGKHSVDVTDPMSVQGFIDLYTDRSIAYGSYQSATIHTKMNHQPIWFYNFNYRGQYTYGDYFASTKNETIDFNWGVSHCDDLLYLFDSPGLFPPLTNPTDIELSYSMIKIWTNFAIYGTPNAPEKICEDSDWEPLDLKSGDQNTIHQLCYLNVTGFYGNYFIGKKDCGYNKERISFWENQDLLENYNGLFT